MIPLFWGESVRLLISPRPYCIERIRRIFVAHFKSSSYHLIGDVTYLDTHAVSFFIEERMSYDAQYITFKVDQIPWHSITGPALDNWRA